MSPSRGANDPTVAAGHLRWRTMNAEQRREAIVEAVVELTEAQGYPPLRGELAKHCGMDLKTIRRYLHDLMEAGVLEEPGGVGSRTLRRAAQKLAELDHGDPAKVESARPVRKSRSKSRK